MPRPHELPLRYAIRKLRDMWRDEAGRRYFDLLDGASPSALAELEDLLGAPLPLPVRTVLELLDGSQWWISPTRPDKILSVFAITMQLNGTDRRDLVPLIDLGLDPETGVEQSLCVACDDAWGTLIRHDETGYRDSALTLADWFEQIIADWRGYEPPDPRRLVVDEAWSRRDAVPERTLQAAAVGCAVASFQPGAKKHRRNLYLFIHVEPGGWACGAHRHAGVERPLLDMCVEVAAELEREITRDRSQWLLTPAEVARRLSLDPESGQPRGARELYEGTVRIEPR